MSTSTVDRATDALRALIVRGHYQPGDRLPTERELAVGLGVSRPTMREVIRRLSDAALLEPRRGSGTYVAEVDLEAVFAVRLQLEPYAAGLAAARRDAAQARNLSTLVNRLAKELDLPEDFAITDLEIHALVTAAAGNSVLLDVLFRLSELANLSRAITSPERAARTTTLRHMQQLARAVHSRDEEAAATVMREHLSSVRDIARAKALRNPRDRRLTPDMAVAPHRVVLG
jgi:GntR family transcriptional repressor for pyruvate dehydrogenase complex